VDVESQGHIPKGFVGTWETVEPIRKYYAIAQ